MHVLPDVVGLQILMSLILSMLAGTDGAPPLKCSAPYIHPLPISGRDSFRHNDLKLVSKGYQLLPMLYK